MSTSEETKPTLDVHDRIFRSLERLEKQNTALRVDFEGLYQAFLQMQRDVQFFSRRCEERGNLIREFASQLRENGSSVESAAVLDFLGRLECTGTPIRPPSGTHPAVEPPCEPDEKTAAGTNK